MFASQLSGHCNVITDRLWRHQQNMKRASKTRAWCVKILVFRVIVYSLCRIRNKIMYVLLWRTVNAPTPVLFWCLFPSLLRNSGKKRQDNPLVSALTVRHASTYIVLYVWQVWSVSLVKNSCWSVGMRKWFNLLHYTGRNYLSIHFVF